MRLPIAGIIKIVFQPLISKYIVNFYKFILTELPSISAAFPGAVCENKRFM